MKVECSFHNIFIIPIFWIFLEVVAAAYCACCKEMFTFYLRDLIFANGKILRMSKMNLYESERARASILGKRKTYCFCNPKIFFLAKYSYLDYYD